MAKHLLFILFLPLLFGCTKDVVTDYNAAVNYNKFKTYQFVPFSTPQAMTLDGSRIEDAIATQLYAKGLTATSDNPDLLVRHSIVEQSDFQSYGTSFGFGYGYRNMGIAYSTPTQIREYRYGKIVVELIDTKTNNVVWRATSQRKLTESMTPSSRKAFIDTQVNEMFKEYPPN